MPYYVYIDESGDEGFSFQPPPRKRGTEWFILSAVVVDSDLHRSVTASYGALKRLHRKQSNWHLHFVKASHDDRIGILSWMATVPLVCMSVLVHKPSITNREAFSLPYRLYFYAARILLERVSWYCARAAEQNFQSAPDAHVVLSGRRGLKQESMREYLRYLRFQAGLEERFNVSLLRNTIKWEAISPDRVFVHPHPTLVGLQLADGLVSGIAKAVELNEYGLTEHRYAKILKPVIYRSFGTYRSYGLKFFPQLHPSVAAQPRFGWLKHFR